MTRREEVDQMRSVQCEMNKGAEQVGGLNRAAEWSIETAGSAIEETKETVVSMSAWTERVGTTILVGMVPRAAGHPGECLPGPGREGSPSVGFARCPSPACARSVDATCLRHDSHEQPRRSSVT